MANDQKVSLLAEVSVPDFNDDIYLVDDTGPTSNKCGVDRLLGLGGFIPGGRLTTESGVAISSSDRTSQGTLYYTPYAHNMVRIYDGTRWRVYTFSERSLSLTATVDKNYDVFLYDNAGTLTLELSSAWTNDSTRANALTTQDGVKVKSGATTRLWLGTIRASASNAIEDSLQKRFVWNAYNQVERPFNVLAGGGHTYNSATVREWNNETTARLHFVNGDTQTIIAGATTYIQNGANGIPVVYVAADWTSGVPSVVFVALANNNNSIATVTGVQFGGYGAQTFAAGYHYILPLEVDFAAVTSTFDNHRTTGALFN